MTDKVSISEDKQGGASPSNQDANMRQKAAARYLGISHRTLEAWRCKGGGPKYRKLGKIVIYARNDLDEFSDSCARWSTSAKVTSS
jgi:hypothetical protein